MSIYQETLKEELKRNLESQKVFSKKLESSLRGSLCIKKINSNDYYYLKYRQDNKVVTKYVGSVKNSNIEQIRKEINKSNEMNKVLHELKRNEKKLRRAIKVL